MKDKWKESRDDSHNCQECRYVEHDRYYAINNMNTIDQCNHGSFLIM